MNSSLTNILKLSSIDAAPLLLGCTIGRETPEGLISLKIVETEAYHQDDPASHSFRGPTTRTAPMFESGGHIYIYFTYGMHYCVNIVTGREGVGEAVLLRAGQPIAGAEIMRKYRHGITDFHNLANGPAKLTQALGIKDTKLSGTILNKSSIWLESPKERIKAENIIASPRIGIRRATGVPWRFYIKNNSFVSSAIKPV